MDEALLNLYHVQCKQNLGYDSYSEFVVAHHSQDDARNAHPSGADTNWQFEDNGWIEKNKTDALVVTFIGIASQTIKEPRVIVASYHAG